MNKSTTLARRFSDAATMFAVSAVCLLLLVFVAYGKASRTFEQLLIEKLVAQGQLVQSTVETYVRPGLPLRQWAGYQQTTEPMVKADEFLVAMITFDREGDPVFVAGDRRIRPLDPAGAQVIANGKADLRSSDKELQVILPLRNKFERVGDLMVAMDRGKVIEKVQTAFLPIVIFAGIASTFFSIVVFASWQAPETKRKRRAAITFAGTFLAVAAAIVLAMISLFSDGAQSKGRALADSLGQRLDDITNYKLQLDQIDGLGAVLSEYRRLNTDVTAASIIVNGRIVEHTDPTAIGRFWTSDPSTYEYRVNITPPDYPRAVQVVVALPRSIVYWQVARSVKNFAALFVASAFFAFLFMQVAQATQHARRAATDDNPDWRSAAALDLVKPIFFLAVFVDHLSYAFLPQFVSGLVAAESLPQSYVAAPFTAYYLCFALALMPAGRYETRFGSRPLILGGLVLSSAALLAMAFAPTFLAILLARVSAGIGQGILFIGVQGYVLSKAARENRTKANAIIVFGFQAGMISGMAIGSLLVSQIQPTGVFMFGGVVAALATFYAATVLPREGNLRPAGPPAHTSGQIWREIGLMLRDFEFVKTIVLVGIPAKAVLTGAVLFATPLLLHARGFAQEDIGQITMVYAGCVIFASSLAANLADRHWDTKSVLSWGAVLTAAGLLTIGASDAPAVASSPWHFALTTALTIGGIAVVGLAHGLINAPVVTHVADTNVAARIGAGPVAAAYRFLERAGHTLGPAIVAQLFVHLGTLSMAFTWVGIGVLGLGLLFLISARGDLARNIREERA
jgi:predicted MFS family arabinose efflux permease